MKSRIRAKVKGRTVTKLGKSIAAMFRNRQNVKVTGQAGKSYFSQEKEKYLRIDPYVVDPKNPLRMKRKMTRDVYLYAYRRGQNTGLLEIGDKKRMKGITFFPRKKK